MTVLAASVSSGPPPLVGARRTLAIAAVLAGMTLAVLDAGMMTMALPSLGTAFDVSPASAISAVTAYQAGLIIALLPMGAVGERLGHRKVFAFSVMAFALASGVGAAAPGFPWLMAARFVQGIGGAGIMALGLALLRFTVPRERLGAAIGWNALTVALASAAAPTVGALALAVGDWRGLLILNLPIAGLTLLATRALPATPQRRTPLDLTSMGLNALMFAMLILAVQAVAQDFGRALALLAAALTALVLLVSRESPKAAPLFPLDLLGREPFRLSVIASICCFTAQSAGLLALPFLLQQRLEQAPLAAGFYITAWPLSVALAAMAGGRLADRMPTAWLCALGGGGLAAGLAGCAALPSAHPAELLPFIVLSGLGFGLFQSPNNRNLFLSAPRERSGAAGGMQGTARVAGQTMGALLMSLLFGQMPLDAALTVGFAIATAFALAAAIVSLLRIVAWEPSA